MSKEQQDLVCTAIDRLEPIVRKSDRIVQLTRPWVATEYRRPQQATDHKPHGLWYACGLEWLEYMASEMCADWFHPFVYRLHLQEDRMLRIATASGLLDFTSRYQVPKYRQGDAISWGPIALIYDGIEICPYIGSLRLDPRTNWYYTWDVASGCVWEPSAILEMEPLLEGSV